MWRCARMDMSKPHREVTWMVVAGMSLWMTSCRGLDHQDAKMAPLPLKESSSEAQTIHAGYTATKVMGSNVLVDILQAAMTQHRGKPTGALTYLLDDKKNNKQFYALTSQCMKSADEQMSVDAALSTFMMSVIQHQPGSLDLYTQSRWELLRSLCFAVSGDLGRGIDGAMGAEAVFAEKDWRIPLQLCWLYWLSDDRKTSTLYYQKANSYGAPGVMQSPEKLGVDYDFARATASGH